MAHKCKVCNGDKLKTCSRCGGAKKMETGEKCYHCDGKGRVPCDICDKNGMVED